MSFKDSDKRGESLSFLFVVLFSIVTFFAFNSDLPTDIMESRNIVTAREMVSDGNWLVPTMNGELRLEKPPLPTWVAGIIEEVCPGSLGAQRAAAGVMGLTWTLFLYLFAKFISRRRDYALLTVMVFLTSYHIVVMGRTATWDIYCHAFMMGGIYFMARGLYDERVSGLSHRLWFPAAGLMMGLSFLSKGPVSFYALLLPALIASLCLPRPKMKGKWGWLVLMIVICVVVSSWWYVYLLMFHHDAVTAVINKESGAWSGHNVRPWYYYWRFFSETGVWALLMLASLAVTYWKRTLKDQRTYIFSIAWTLATLVLLSLMPEKKIRYLLPMMASCAMCVACLLEHMDGTVDKVSRWLLRVNGFVVGIIALALPVAAIVMHWLSVSVEILLCVLFLAVGVFIVVSSYRLKAKRMVYGVCLMFMLTECFLLKPIGGAFGNPGRRSISLTRNMTELQGVPFYHPANDTIRIELVYEAQRKILPVNVNSSDSLMRLMPFALVSHEYASQVLPKSVLMHTDTVGYGTFDDNRHPKTDRHYTKDFIYHITLIKEKNNE